MSGHPQQLTVLRIQGIRTPGDYGDGYGGNGLKVRARETLHRGLTKTFIVRIHWKGRTSNLSLSTYPEMSLKDARIEAGKYQDLIRKGIHPRHYLLIPTFAEAAETYIRTHYGKPKYRKRAAEWRSLLEREAYSVLGHLRVDEVTSVNVEDALRGTWYDVPKTARRLRYMISKIMLWAQGRGHRNDDPASNEIIKSLLPRVDAPVGHMPSVPHQDIGLAAAAMVESDAHPTTQLCALFIVLTACRSQEARLATWAEIDWESAMWTIPKENAKRRREHRVPLSAGALRILERAKILSGGEAFHLVFPSPVDPCKPLSRGSLLKRLKAVDPTATIHGLRSTFRTWGAENDLPNEVGRAALAHRKEDQMDEIYDRSDLVDARREAMARWNNYVEGQVLGGWDAILEHVDRRLRAEETCLRIRGQRDEWGLTQMGLADLLNLSTGIIGRIENGGVPRSGRILQTLEEWLDKDVPKPDPDPEPEPIQEPEPVSVFDDLGARIKEARRAWFLTQELLADRLGVSVGTIARLEHGGNLTQKLGSAVLGFLAEPVPTDLLRLRERAERLRDQLPLLIMNKRREWSMTYSAAGAYLGVHRGTVVDWEQEKCQVSDKHLPTVLAWLDAPLTDRPCMQIRSTGHSDGRLIVEQMKRERKRLGISQSKLASILDVNRKRPGEWERGEHYPSSDSLERIVRWLESLPTDENLSLAA